MVQLHAVNLCCDIILSAAPDPSKQQRCTLNHHTAMLHTVPTHLIRKQLIKDAQAQQVLV
jgi:hypothetical protein